ncbi:MAG: PKD domain-containing protein, partial [Patulibacter sp.]
MRHAGRAAITLPLIAAPVAHAGPALQLQIDGASLAVPPGDLDGASDVARTRPVTVRSASGSQRQTAGGTSARRLVELVGIAPAAVTSLTVQAGGTENGGVSISGAELRGGFAGDPLCPACDATFDAAYGEGTVAFFRPLRDAADLNAADHVQPALGQSLIVRVDSVASRIPVSVSVSDSSPDPGEAVQLRAVVPDGERPELTWYFGDGTSGSGAAATHRYEAGHWTAGVMAHDAAGYGAATAVLSVGDAAPASLAPAPS